MTDLHLEDSQMEDINEQLDEMFNPTNQAASMKMYQMLKVNEAISKICDPETAIESLQLFLRLKNQVTEELKNDTTPAV